MGGWRGSMRVNGKNHGKLFNIRTGGSEAAFEAAVAHRKGLEAWAESEKQKRMEAIT
jgi:hypothetical protein